MVHLRHLLDEFAHTKAMHNPCMLTARNSYPILDLPCAQK